MTEVERIIKDGILPESFFEEELRCDFLVTKERKKVWAVLIDLMLQLDRVCSKYGLRYFVTGGTLLGTVRHHGFIPWDDDVDVAMFRTDYIELQKHADEFDHPYFLQTPYTEPNYYFSFARLINDNTTYCSEMFAFQGYHAGISIDIFPIDDWDLTEGKKAYDRIDYLNKENSTFMRMKNPHLNSENLARVAGWSGIDPLKAYEEIQCLAMQFCGKETEYYSNAVVTIWKYGKDVYRKCCIANLKYMDFETIRVPVPCGHHEVLEGLYGDYMRLPPIEKRGTWHAHALIDPDKPYKVVLEEYKQTVL